jgi:adenylate cyclase
VKSPFEDISDWLLTKAKGDGGLRGLTGQLVSRLRDAGVPIHRFNVGVFALHPVMAGYAVVWTQGMDEAIEVPVRREDTLKPLYLASPIRLVVESRQTVSFDLKDAGACEGYPVLGEFRDEGYTNYIGFPIPYGEDGIAVLTACTKEPEGFSAAHVLGIQSLFPVLSLLISVTENRRLTRTIVRTYLGENIGERVLSGEMLRGHGETIQAALWFCDLRDFTALTAEIGSFAMIDVMNQYFDCMAEAVWAEGGEILKFMGDAMLVVFRIGDELDAGEAARHAVSAAKEALQRLSFLSKRRAGEGLSPLHASVSVHLGSVVYGNIGASRRLDFTVMGAAVNLVSRIQGLTAKTGETLLYSKEVAEHLTEMSEPFGSYDLKGVLLPVDIYKPKTGS